MDSQLQHVLILGGGYAGLACALRLARLAPTLAITLVDARAEFSQRVRLHQVAAGQAIARVPFAAMVAGTGITFVQARVQSIAPDKRLVHTTAGQMVYDRLVIALGSDTRPDVEGVREHCDHVGSQEAAERLAQKIARLPAQSQVAIVGGGLTGLESACELAESRSDLQVTLITRGHFGDGWLAESSALKARRVLATLGITLVENVEIQRVSSGSLHASTGVLPFDVCVWTTGFVANDLAQRAGLVTTTASRLAVDATLRTLSHRDIYGIGDAALPTEEIGAPVLMSCRLGMPSGIQAAKNLSAEARNHAPTRWQVRDAGRCISLGREQGLLQFHRANGSLRNFSMSGKAAAWLKEMICRGTLWFLQSEAKRTRNYYRRNDHRRNDHRRNDHGRNNHRPTLTSMPPVIQGER